MADVAIPMETGFGGNNAMAAGFGGLVGSWFGQAFTGGWGGWGGNRGFGQGSPM